MLVFPKIKNILLGVRGLESFGTSDLQIKEGLLCVSINYSQILFLHGGTLLLCKKADTICQPKGIKGTIYSAVYK